MPNLFSRISQPGVSSGGEKKQLVVIIKHIVYGM